MRIKVFGLNKKDNFIKQNRNVKIGDEFEVIKIFRSRNNFYLGQDGYLINDKDNKPIVLYDEEIIIMEQYEN